jgi:phenylalanyl-tRNA synthetase beta chain
MTISYNWLCEYIPVPVHQDDLGRMLTSVGLEVENMVRYESIKGNLQGLVVGEVMKCTAHPNADKLKVTEVDTGEPHPLQIVCGAPNVGVKQKVIVAKPGTTIYPVKGTPVTMKIATIRGIESQGMICSSDEIGIGNEHTGIVVLPDHARPGQPVSEIFRSYDDWIYEIGLTPNRMDAMSHLGVARDICAYLTHHQKKPIKAKFPSSREFVSRVKSDDFKVTIENKQACRRYSGVTITGITVSDSPQWLKDRLQSIGQRPINNIVDITNFILHESGQPLHAFDAEKIANRSIRIKNLPSGTVFTTLDEKDRKLEPEDLMICDGNSQPLCIAGVFGGVQSGVTASTNSIFLESAWFNPPDIRKTSFRHGLRTDAATRFEKNVDISNTVNVLKRAALLICEIAGGNIASEIIDVYPEPREKTIVSLNYAFLQKLSGKIYSTSTVTEILSALSFEIIKSDNNSLHAAVPFSKPDIALAADLVEEVMRIDGYDNIEIPSSITITPSVGEGTSGNIYREKTAAYLTGLGFNEIFTNSITNKAYFSEEELKGSVQLLNNLSAMHNVMRPSMLETGLEAIAYNLNRKNSNLHFYEFGKTYQSKDVGRYEEVEHLCLYITGDAALRSWKKTGKKSDLYYIKGLAENILMNIGLPDIALKSEQRTKLAPGFKLYFENKVIGYLGAVGESALNRFDLRQPVWFADLNWHDIVQLREQRKIVFEELPRQLPVNRDLAMVVPRNLHYGEVEDTIRKVRLDKLQQVELFDIFESEKLGNDRKSLAVSFTFLDKDKTLTDKEIDEMMNQIMEILEKDLSAEIRKQ